jgi:hypothetical protein
VPDEIDPSISKNVTRMGDLMGGISKVKGIIFAVTPFGSFFSSP